LAASNHKLLYLAVSAGFALACNYTDGDSPDYDARVNYSTFEIGAYSLKFGERYSGDDK
jgi:hypothetical protein